MSTISSTWPPARTTLDGLLDRFLSDIDWRSPHVPVSNAWIGKWFGQGDAETKAAFDEAARAYLPLIEAAIEAGSDRIEEVAVDADSALALTLLLDQLPRNCHRSEEVKANICAFSHSTVSGTSKEGERGTVNRSDPLALSLVLNKVLPSQWHVDDSQGGPSNPLAQLFLTLPLEHSEDLATQRHYHALATQLAKQSTEERRNIGEACLKAADAHLDLIERFGRFPHRNQALGREDTEGERTWREKTGGKPFG